MYKLTLHILYPKINYGVGLSIHFKFLKLPDIAPKTL